MATLGKRIREARENKGLLQTQLAKMIGARSAGVISNWENDLNKPDIDKIIAMCKAMDVSISVLVGYSAEDEFVCSPSEQRIIEKYRCLNDHGKTSVDLILNHEYEAVAPIAQTEDVYRLVARGESIQAAELANADNMDKLAEIFDEQFADDKNESDTQESD